MMTLMMTAIALAIAAPAAAQSPADPHAAHAGPADHGVPKAGDEASGCCDKAAVGNSKDCCDKAKSRDCCEKSEDADGSKGHAHGH